MIRFFCCLMVYFSIAMSEEVVFAVDDWEPYIGAQMEQYGPAAMLVQEMCRRAGDRAVFVWRSWRGAYELTKHGRQVQASVLWKKSKKNIKYLYFSASPIHISQDRFYYLKARFPEGFKEPFGFETIKRAGLKVVGVSGYTNTETMREMDIDIQVVSNAKIALNHLIKKQTVDGYLDDPKVMFGLMTQHYLYHRSKVTFMESKDFIKAYYVVYSKNPQGKRLKDRYDPILKNMLQSGQVQEIYSQFLPEQ
jgi:polar amino acid transport system substrate-binding protein